MFQIDKLQRVITFMFSQSKEISSLLNIAYDFQMRNESILYIYRYVSHAKSIKSPQQKYMLRYQPQCNLVAWLRLLMPLIRPLVLLRFNPTFKIGESMCIVPYVPCAYARLPTRGRMIPYTKIILHESARRRGARSHRHSNEQGITSGREHPRGPPTGSL